MKKLEIVKSACAYAIVAFAAEVESYGQSGSLDTFFSDATTATKTAGKNAIDFITVIVGLAALVLLAVNFMKRKDGEQNSNEAIVGWLKGLIFTFIGLTVIRAIFFR